MVYDRGDGPVHALEKIDLAIAAGSLLTIVGPSGCGKTTLLDLVAGFRRPSTGSIQLNGREIWAPGRDRGVVFQQPALLPWMSVSENISFGQRLSGMAKRERNRSTVPMLELVGLSDFPNHRPYELSAGMQQRVSIARALANDPAVLLMDEPFAALDALTRDQMQERLLEIWGATQKTILFITHSVEEAVFLGSRLIVLSPRPGRLIADVQLPFGAAVLQHGLDRTIRAQPAFVETRERVLSLILGDRPPAEAGVRRWTAEVELDPPEENTRSKTIPVQ